jgi:ribonuclease Y
VISGEANLGGGLTLNSIAIAVGIALCALVAGALVGFLIRKRIAESRIELAEETAKKVLERAKKEAETVKKEAQLQVKEDLYKAKGDFEKETRSRRLELHELEKRIVQREENIDKKVELLDQKEGSLSKREKNLTIQERQIAEKDKELHTLLDQQRLQLEKISGMSSEEAKKVLMQSMENDAKHEAAKTIRRIEEEARETADKMARNILALAIQRYSADYVAEKTVSVVTLPNEEMKGRIIGREGRNIRSIEAATGVDLIIDDTPEAVILSGFDPIRREIARISLERLINDGRIHPARIEEIVEKVKQEMDVTVREAGEQATFDSGAHGVNGELIKLLGKLKYRTSYDQNVLQHSLEVAAFCGIIASELGLSVKKAKRAGLLHDIGKAIDHEVEGSHALIGADLARKFGEDDEIIHAIAAHHDDEKPQTVIAILVQVADTLSAARPGARREMLETYVKHLKELEEISLSFPGVSKSYAVQAGREIRIIVESKDVSDDDAVVLSRDVARKIESNLSYPGQIKITVIRETRAVEFAK